MAYIRKGREQMRRGTDVFYKIKSPIDLSEYEIVRVDHKQGSTLLIKELNDGVKVDGYELTVTLTQEEINKFNEGVVDIQMRYKKNDTDLAKASKVTSVYLYDVLEDGVI